jgi:hypothetical protein
LGIRTFITRKTESVWSETEKYSLKVANFVSRETTDTNLTSSRKAFGARVSFKHWTTETEEAALIMSAPTLAPRQETECAKTQEKELLLQLVHLAATALIVVDVPLKLRL